MSLSIQRARLRVRPELWTCSAYLQLYVGQVDFCLLIRPDHCPGGLYSVWGVKKEPGVALGSTVFP
ncbi:hypothetical protein JMJ77_0009598 [Colletotrichum scovillei]|uniref:Uncharacterized protein n=1 Tax=Colletotrichum scovillei TaxID=1209932 RepID=A0A9P7R081_9PEZI|nr:hypothetical protein JMJ77_0009598 [Colletotrichum scovillei]KAG7052676.1 hypothetical protein JMJ78_0005691 [Colletotrichum scovillei]KAG7064970.1 hypothetical protein JMJ76_0012725 [Colletotrichum scovillei]